MSLLLLFGGEGTAPVVTATASRTSISIGIRIGAWILAVLLLWGIA